MIYATEIAAMILVAFQPVVAQQTGVMPQMPWPMQAGAIAMLGGLLWWQMAKTAPTESKRRGEELDRMLSVHKETSDNISDNIKEMTSEIKSMTVGTQELLTTMKERQCPIITNEQFSKLMNQ